jgi:hypothetical protein
MFGILSIMSLAKVTSLNMHAIVNKFFELLSAIMLKELIVLNILLSAMDHPIIRVYHSENKKRKNYYRL